MCIQSYFVPLEVRKGTEMFLKGENRWDCLPYTNIFVGVGMGEEACGSWGTAAVVSAEFNRWRLTDYNQDNLLVTMPVSWSDLKGCKFDSWQEQQKKFSSPDISLCRLTGCPFHPRNNAVACKRPHSFCKKCRWQVTTNYAYTFDLIKSEWATSLFRHTVASRLSSLNHCGLILV